MNEINIGYLKNYTWSVEFLKQNMAKRLVVKFKDQEIYSETISFEEDSMKTYSAIAWNRATDVIRRHNARMMQEDKTLKGLNA